MPIIDSHCHAWRRWPYQPPVPDFESRGLVEQLLFEMDAAGVDQAAVVCARIEHNPDDNDYVAECVRRYPSRRRLLSMLWLNGSLPRTQKSALRLVLKSMMLNMPWRSTASRIIGSLT